MTIGRSAANGPRPVRWPLAGRCGPATPAYRGP